MKDLADRSTPELLRLHASLGDLLRERGIIRSANNPTGDYGEYLFAKAFGWSLVGNSTAAYDAIGPDGSRYQIKTRRMTRGKHISRQLGAMRNLPDKGFDYLAAAILTGDYRVHRAIIIPHALIEPLCRFSNHVNGWILRLDDGHWSVPGVIDATDTLRTAEG